MFISTLWLILGCCAAIEAAASQLADEEPDRLPLAEGRHYEAHHVA